MNGRPHAEFNALNKKLNFKGSDLYVTLEPCTHYGLTPPCTNLIKQKRSIKFSTTLTTLIKELTRKPRRF